MKVLSILTFALLLSIKCLAWGSTGHRVIGLIAENHLTKKTKKSIDRILSNETLAEVSTFMDFIKSDRKYDHMSPWHYCTIPDGKTYEESGTPEGGDAVTAIRRLISELKSKQFTDEDESFALKLLVHLIGDIHQPLHVGNGEDRGGNDIKIEYFWRSSNLHRVWDSGIIDQQNFSYTEYADWIDHANKEKKEIWSNDDLMTWIYESRDLRNQVYEIPESERLSYGYNYKNLEIVNQRLLQAGIRLAAVLNSIYG